MGSGKEDGVQGTAVAARFAIGEGAATVFFSGMLFRSRAEIRQAIAGCQLVKIAFACTHSYGWALENAQGEEEENDFDK